MRVVVPEVGSTDARTIHALECSGFNYELADVSSDDNAYHRLLCELWDTGETFCLVEHDIEIGSDTLQQFEACPEPWCTAPYLGRPYKSYPVPVLRVALGCTRFRAEFLKTNAGVLEAMLPGPSNSLRNPRHWRRCDSLLASALQRRGFRACEHEPFVKHHHDYQNETVSTGWL